MAEAFQDPTGRGDSAPVLALRGFVYLSVVATIAVLLLKSAGGAFHDFVPATAVVQSVGDGLDGGADVKLRGVLVGSVESVESADGGTRHEVQLRLDPEQAAAIPASVRARIIPTNIFGQPSVELLPGSGRTGVLEPGATIPGDESQETLQLQSAISNLQRLLIAVEPSKLNATLRSIKQAFDGRGAQVGSMIDRLHRYVGKLNPQSAEFADLLTSAGTALDAAADTAPGLLDTVDDLLPTARTFAGKRDEFDDTLTQAGELLDTVDGFLRRNGGRIESLTESGSHAFGALAADPAAVPASFRALGRGVEALGRKFDQGTGHLDIGGSFLLAPYDPYTAADCPRYPGLDAPNCSHAAPRSRASRPSRAADGGLSGLLLGPLAGGAR